MELSEFLEFEKKAQEGDTFSQYILGCYFFNGEGTDVDYQKAIFWFEKAAQKGDISSQFYLIDCYLDGLGTDVDYNKARYWLNHGEIDIRTLEIEKLIKLLSHLPFNSNNFKLFECAAQQGFVEAQMKLGSYYYEKAIYWYKKAAEQGNDEAKIILEEYNAKKRAEELSKKANFAKKRDLIRRQIATPQNEDDGGTNNTNTTQNNLIKRELTRRQIPTPQNKDDGGTNNTNTTQNNLIIGTDKQTLSKASLLENGYEYIMPIKKVYYYDEYARTHEYDSCYYELLGKPLGSIVLFKLVQGSTIYDVEKIKSKYINVDYGLEHVEVNASFNHKEMKRTYYFCIPY